MNCRAVAGFALVVTTREVGSLEPQEFFAETEIIPPVDPALEVIEVVVEFPFHPEGIDHIYDVAPGTAAMM